MRKNINGIFIFVCVLAFATGCRSIESPQDEQVFKRYYPDGILKSIWVTKSGKLNGIKRIYTEDGTLEKATEYNDDVIDGMNNIYYADGAIWKKETYQNGRLLNRKEFDEEGILTNEEKLADKEI